MRLPQGIHGVVGVSESPHLDETLRARSQSFGEVPQAVVTLEVLDIPEDGAVMPRDPREMAVEGEHRHASVTGRQGKRCGAFE